jgi:hypothetical protein
LDSSKQFIIEEIYEPLKLNILRWFISRNFNQEKARVYEQNGGD